MSTETAKQFLCTEANCNRRFATEVDLNNHQRAKHRIQTPTNVDAEPDWEGECEVCGASPIVPLTGMCGPCSFGQASAIGGNW